MGGVPPLSDDELLEAVNAFKRCGGNRAEAAVLTVGEREHVLSLFEAVRLAKELIDAVYGAEMNEAFTQPQ